jgi:hypothetical protein
LVDRNLTRKNNFEKGGMTQREELFNNRLNLNASPGQGCPAVHPTYIFMEEYNGIIN